MKEEYKSWIAAFEARHVYLRGLCGIAARAMAAHFSGQLTAVPGWAILISGRSVEHWWCETSTGEIVDPTAAQFLGAVIYRKFEPGDEVRVGRCMECGVGIYREVQSLKGDRESFCGPNCERAFCNSTFGG